ncbi:flavin-containing monooxygenase 5-like [Parasteatoda tepidariorum]|uniref:flavin-containing monooxygenase 5-like n=1 Tax=Parasteatoda tepidariorum TaxID=114398 RepID=UPI0039BCE276
MSRQSDISEFIAKRIIGRLEYGQMQRSIADAVEVAGCVIAKLESILRNRVYLSTRTGAHVLSRVGPYGLPMDYALARRYLTISIDLLPIQSSISKFTENGVIFEGESSVTETDVVIMATGYTWKFPFLEDDVRADMENHFVGFFLPFGASFLMGELQCRWVAQVFAGNVKLPPRETLMDDIRKRLEINEKRYAPCSKQGVRVDYTQFQDKIAEQIGAKPNFYRMLFTDPQLWFKLIFGPSVPYHYRLQGPHPWEDAREAIMKCGH